MAAIVDRRNIPLLLIGTENLQVLVETIGRAVITNELTTERTACDWAATGSNPRRIMPIVLVP